MTQRTRPLLYSFRRCPYAMRARLGLKSAQIEVELREIVLRNKPEHMLSLSPKATVPVLRLEDGTVIDESLDIVKWALAKNDPQNLLEPETATQGEMHALITQNDGPFKHHLDRTKYAVRYPEDNPSDHRDKASQILVKLDKRLQHQTYLCGNQQSLADITISPFVRQFANIDKNWFETQSWPHLLRWHNEFLESQLFQSIMEKYPAWQQDDPITLF